MVLTIVFSFKGVNFMEKTISIRGTEITFSIWDLGGVLIYTCLHSVHGLISKCAIAGQREFVNMLPLVCNDAVAILFMFDLSRKSTLNSVKEWYRQARGFNKVLPLFLCKQHIDAQPCHSLIAHAS